MAWMLLSMILIVASCAPVPVRDPAVTQDLVAYVDKIKKWEPVEVEVLKAMHDVRRSQYVDDDYVIATLGEVMDDMELHLEEIERYQPRTGPVIAVHERYRTAWHDLHDSFSTIIDAMQKKEYMRLSHATEAMARSRGELITVAASLSQLLEDSGLREPPGNAVAS